MSQSFGESPATVWAFDLGKGSIGEAVREGNKFPHKASLRIPADFAERMTDAQLPAIIRSCHA